MPKTVANRQPGVIGAAGQVDFRNMELVNSTPTRKDSRGNGGFGAAGEVDFRNMEFIIATI